MAWVMAYALAACVFWAFAEWVMADEPDSDWLTHAACPMAGLTWPLVICGILLDGLSITPGAKE